MARIRTEDPLATNSSYEGYEDSFFLEDMEGEPKSIYLDDDWDTMMEDFGDEYDEFNDIDFPTLDDDF